MQPAPMNTNVQAGKYIVKVLPACPCGILRVAGEQFQFRLSYWNTLDHEMLRVPPA